MGLFDVFGKKTQHIAERVIYHASSIHSNIRKKGDEAGMPEGLTGNVQIYMAAIITAVCWLTRLMPESGMTESILKKTFSVYNEKWGRIFYKSLIDCFEYTRGSLNGAVLSPAVVLNVTWTWLMLMLTTINPEKKEDSKKMGELYDGLEDIFVEQIADELPAIINHIKEPGDPAQEWRDFYKSFGVDIDSFDSRV